MVTNVCHKPIIADIFIGKNNIRDKNSKRIFGSSEFTTGFSYKLS